MRRDSRRAWLGAYPGQPELPVRVETAAVGERAVWLRVFPPWVEAGQEATPPREISGRLTAATAVVGGLLVRILLAAAALLARRNLRRGRGDRRGALRLALAARASQTAYRALE